MCETKTTKDKFDFIRECEGFTPIFPPEESENLASMITEVVTSAVIPPEANWKMYRQESRQILDNHSVTLNAVGIKTLIAALIYETDVMGYHGRDNE